MSLHLPHRVLRWFGPEKEGYNRTVFWPATFPAKLPLFFSICDGKKQLPPPCGRQQAGRWREEGVVVVAGGVWWLAGGMVHGA